MFSKKAQIEIQFNWIFVIIAGIVLLGFFLMLIGNQSSTTEQKISVSLTRHFRTIMDSTAQKAGTFKQFDFPAQFTTEFFCNISRNLHYYTLQDVKVTDIKYEVIFAPRKMTGKSIYTWTNEWEIPDEQGFSVGTFLYLTNKLQGYIFRNSSSDAFTELYQLFPDNATKLLSNGETFSEMNLNSYSYIILADSIENGETFNTPLPENSKVIVINPAKTEDVFHNGELCFCDSVDNCWIEEEDQYICNGESSYYLGAATLYGAIYSSDINYYECMMQKAFDKLRLTMTMQYYWLESVMESSEIDYFCQMDLDDPLDWLNEISNPTNGNDKGILETPFKDFTDWEYLIETIEKIHRRNKVLALSQNCVQLY